MSFLSVNTENILIQYMDDTYPIVLAQQRPFFDRITKRSNMGGLSTKVPFNVGYGGGQGGTFANALANAQDGGAVHQAWTISPAKAYGITTVTNDEVPYTQTPESAIDMLTDATKGAMELAAQNFSAIMFGTGYGNLATIKSNSNPSGNLYLLTLNVPSDVNKFNLNNVIASKATAAAASLDSGTAKVVGLNPQSGIIEVDGGGTWTPTNTHVIGLDGQIAASTALATFPGIFGFVPPVSARTAGVVGDTFLGINRNAATSVVAVSGWALDGTGKLIFPSVNALAGQMASYKNSKPDTLVCNPVSLSRLAAEIDVKVRYDMPSRSVADVFYEGFDLMTPAGKVEVLADSSCPADSLVLTKASTWVYGYPDKPFAPTSLSGRLTVEDYATNKTRFSVTNSGYFYTTNTACTGVITISV